MKKIKIQIHIFFSSHFYKILENGEDIDKGVENSKS